MKKYIYVLLLVILTNALLAQTNTFPATGNVGIGTTTPQAKLDVQGNASFLTGTHSMYINEGYSIDMTRAGIRNNAGNLVLNAKDSGVLFLNRDVYADTRIQSTQGTQTNEIAFFRRDGAVGINTLNIPAGYRFAVNGKAIFTQVKVQVYPWADYVFDADYKLLPLSHVEKFIQQHHHLPDVPSAARVEKEGLDLGQAQATLLKKIEELTLYVIEQNKRIEIQEKEMRELKMKLHKGKAKS